MPIYRDNASQKKLNLFYTFSFSVVGRAFCSLLSCVRLPTIDSECAQSANSLSYL